MTLETWISFVLVVCIFAVIPGPTVILVIGQALANGKRAVVPLTAGVVLGDFVAMSLSFIGLGAVLVASSVLFGILKWFGVCYLIYLGIHTWMSDPKEDTTGDREHVMAPIAMFKSSFLVTALNPKDIVFFIAFLPQFVDSTEPAISQFAILMATFLVIVTTSISCFAAFASSARHRFTEYPMRKLMTRISGFVLVGAGILTATAERN